MSMLLETTTGGNGIWNYVLIAVVAVLLIAMPIMMNARNKRESQKVQEQTNSLKVGDKILTTSGVYGTITEVKFDDTQKLVVIETGGKDKSYLTIDAYSVYTVFKSDEELKKEAEAKAEAEKQAVAEKLEDKPKKSKKPAKEEKTKTPVEAEVVVEEESK